jgi:hypothetical protein
MEFLTNWMDIMWVPVALLLLRKGQRLKGIMFILACVLALRLQVQFMERIHYPTGILPFLDFPLIQRGFIAYGAFIATFLILSHFSREKDHYVYIAAAITVFIAAFCVSSFVLVL